MRVERMRVGGTHASGERAAPAVSSCLVAAAMGALSLVGLAAPGLHAQESSPVSVSAEAAWVTRYLFAGIPFSGDDVLQPHVIVSTSPGFTFNFFGNYDFDAEEFNELDVYADYFRMLSDIVGAYVGAALYNFKNVEEVGEFSATPEIYAGISIYTTLTPSLYVAHDFDLGDGTHVYFSLSHGVPVGSWTLSGAGRIEYNADYWREGSSFSFADLIVSLDVPADVFTISPFVILQAALDDDFDDFFEGGLRVRADF